MIVCLWTPPHFWALALLLREHYERAAVPMLPVVRGEAFTLKRIVGYTVVLVATTVVPVATGTFGVLYLVSALLLGGLFLGMAVALQRRPSKKGRRRALPLLAAVPGAALRRGRVRSAALGAGAGGDRRLAAGSHLEDVPLARVLVPGDEGCEAVRADARGDERERDLLSERNALQRIRGRRAGNAGVIVIGPCTTAHEFGTGARFEHVTRTRQPRGTLTSSSPRP